MNTLKENLKTFLDANLLKQGTRACLKAEICYCQGFLAAMPEGDDKGHVHAVCGMFHLSGRSIL